jgi:hypothetical protein
MWTNTVLVVAYSQIIMCTFNGLSYKFLLVKIQVKGLHIDISDKGF